MIQTRKYFSGIFLSALMLLITCCGVKDSPPSLKSGIKPSRLKPVGYTVQVGAFSKIDNALKQTEALRKAGLKAYHFTNDRGLYKVRFGDFHLRDDALHKARELHRRGIIHDYYIVRPHGYGSKNGSEFSYRTVRDSIVKTARSFLGTPYRWSGSSSEEGFDCSGLTMTVYNLNGLNLPRTVRRQWQVGYPVGRKDLLKGDLVFFSIQEDRKTSHVGIYVGDDRFIHAPGKGKVVEVDSISNPYFSRTYRGARTYLD